MVTNFCVTATKRLVAVLLMVCVLVSLAGCSDWGIAGSINGVVIKYMKETYGYDFKSVSARYSDTSPDEYPGYKGKYMHVACTNSAYRDEISVDLLEVDGEAEGDLEWNGTWYDVYDDFYIVVIQNSLAKVTENQLGQGTMVKAKLSLGSGDRLSIDDVNQGVYHCMGYDSSVVMYIMVDANYVTGEYLTYVKDLITSCNIGHGYAYLCYTERADYENLENDYYNHSDSFDIRLQSLQSVIKIELIEFTREHGVVSITTVKEPEDKKGSGGV